MKKSNFICLIAIAAATLVISFLVQRHAEAALRQNAATLERQQNEIVQATAENQRLSNDVTKTDQAAAGSKRSGSFETELAQLRGKAAALSSQENNLSNQIWRSRLSAGTHQLSTGDYNLLDHNKELATSGAGTPRVDGKLNDARAFMDAVRHYANDHEGTFPSDLGQVTVYLPQTPLDQTSPSWENAPVSGTNNFEIVFQGTTNDLANIPLRRVALIRETQPWPTQNGKWARVYGYADGAANTVESDDNFQSWDAMHIIPPSNQ